jgi:hypothetical protein
MSSDLSRAALLTGGVGALAMAAGGRSLANVLTPRTLVTPRGIAIQRIITPTPIVYDSLMLALMQRAGCTAITDARDGWIHTSAGGHLKPDCPLARTRVIAGKIVTPNDNCQCVNGNNCNVNYEPGGGNTDNYPVIGTVVANNPISVSGSYTTGGSVSGAIYTGTPPSGPYGPYRGGIKQGGFGSTYHWSARELLECGASIGGFTRQVIVMAQRIVAAGATTYGAPAVESAEAALASGGLGTVAGAGEFAIAIFAGLTAPELLAALALGSLGIATVALIVYCLTGS